MAAPPKSPLQAVDLDDLPFHLARAALAFRRYNDQTLLLVGLKPQAPGLATVLHVLEDLGDCRVNALVERTHLPNGTLTGLLDTLERDRCIKRIRNPDDGRSWHIGLTKKGHKLCGKLHQRHRLVMAGFRDALSGAETAELKRLLGRVTAHMRAHRTGGGTPP